MQFSLTNLLNSQIVTSSYIINHLNLTTWIRYPIAKLWELADSVHRRIILMHVFLFWFEGFFLLRSHPQKVVSEQIAKVFFSKEPFFKGTSEHVISFIATYPKLKDSGQLIKSLQLLLYCNCEVGRLFSPAPIVS